MTESRTRLAIIGAGPGGYAAAFRAADLGMQVTLIDPEQNPGGVCLHRGCIPSKALLHAAATIREAAAAGEFGVEFAPPKIDIARTRSWKIDIVKTLTGQLAQIADKKEITRIRGRARLTGPNALEIALSDGGSKAFAFDDAILATGSRLLLPPGMEVGSPRIMGSSQALDLAEVPESLLVVGGGYIGLELGSVYAALGSEVTVVEMTGGLLPGVDRDLVSVLSRKLKREFTAIMLNTKVTGLEESADKVTATLESKKGETETRDFSRVLIAVGRRPSSEGLGLENTAVKVDEKGFVEADASQRSAEPSIWAIGDLVGEPMLAHKATHEGEVAAAAIAGDTIAFEPNAIPAVVYTDPEIAWAGITETQARAEKREVQTAKIPWRASGRALTLGRDEGITKVIVDPGSRRVLGVGLAGPGAGELIAEAVVAIEMGANAEDLALTIHPHPTLSETIMEAAASLLPKEIDQEGL